MHWPPRWPKQGSLPRRPTWHSERRSAHWLRISPSSPRKSRPVPLCIVETCRIVGRRPMPPSRNSPIAATIESWVANGRRATTGSPANADVGGGVQAHSRSRYHKHVGLPDPRHTLDDSPRVARLAAGVGTVEIAGTSIADTFAEAFGMRYVRLIVTAHDEHWLDAAAAGGRRLRHIDHRLRRRNRRRASAVGRRHARRPARASPCWPLGFRPMRWPRPSPIAPASA